MWWIPLLLQAGLGAIGGGLGAYGTSRQQRAEAEAAKQQREMLGNLIGQLQDSNYEGVKATASSNLSSASGQARANNAARGVDLNRGTNEISNAVLSALTEFMVNDQRNRQGQIGNLLQNPAYGVQDPNTINVGLDTLLGTLTGGAGGAGGGLGQLLGSEAGLQALGFLNQAPSLPAPASGSFGVRTNPNLGPVPSLSPFSGRNAWAGSPIAGVKSGSGWGGYDPSMILSLLQGISNG